MAALRGVYPVFQTPYLDNGAVDFDTLDKEVDWLFSNGAQGVVMAIVSEVLRLSADERDEIAERVCARSKDRGEVIISVGAESTRAAIMRARVAEAVGATAVMAIPPVARLINEAQLFEYFSGLIENVGMPLIVQDASSYVGRPLSTALLTRLLNQYGPERVLFKPETQPLGQKLTELREATDGAARVFEGSGGLSLVDAYRRKIVVGSMPGADLIQAQVALWEALTTGNEKRIYEIHLPLLALVSLQVQGGLDGFLAVEKYLLRKQGIFPNTIVRGPVAYQLDEETRQEVDRLFALLGKALEPTRAEMAGV